MAVVMCVSLGSLLYVEKFFTAGTAKLAEADWTMHSRLPCPLAWIARNVDRGQLVSFFDPALPPRPVHHLLLFGDVFGWRVFVQNLLGQVHVALGPARPRIVEQHRLAMAGSFRQPNVPRDGCVAELLAKEPLQLAHHLLRQVGALIKHGQNHALDPEIGIEAATDALHGVHQFADSFQGEVFRLHGNQDRIRCHQGSSG